MLSENVSSSFSTALNSIPIERGFKMAFLNIVSLPENIDEIRYSMSNKSIDIIAFNKTRLDLSFTDSMIHLDGYNLIRKDRSQKGGGVCMYLRSSINYKIRSDLSLSELEAVCVEITKPHSQPFIAATVYRPPNASLDFFDHLKKLIREIDDENKEMYLLGDLNCDMLKEEQLCHAPLKKLNSLCELYQLTQLIDEPTRITATMFSLIDHVITNTPEKISHSGVVHTGISDHSLVFAIRKIRIIQKKENNAYEIRNMKNFEEIKFLNDLLSQHWEYVYFIGSDPNDMWEIWKELFLEVLDKHAPLQKKRSDQVRSLGSLVKLRVSLLYETN